MTDFTRWLRRQKQLNAGSILSINEAGNPIESTGEQTIRLLGSDTTLADAQIKALPTTPIEILPAPDPGTLRDWTRIILSANLAAAYTNIHSDSAIRVRYGAGGMTHEYYNSGTYFGLDFVSGLLTSTQGTVLVLDPLLDVGAPDLAAQPFGAFQYADVQQALTLSINNSGAGALTGGNADNLVKVTVLYSIVDLT